MKSLREKLEEAVKGLLAVSIDERIETSVDSSGLVYPYILCTYESGESYGPQTGLTWATVTVQTVSEVKPGTASTGDADHNRLVGKVVDALEVDNLADQLTQAGTDLLVVGVESSTEDSTDVEENDQVWIFTSNYSIKVLAGHN